MLSFAPNQEAGQDVDEGMRISRALSALCHGILRSKRKGPFSAVGSRGRKDLKMAHIAETARIM